MLIIYIVDCCAQLWKYIEVIFKEIVDKFDLEVNLKNIFDLAYPELLLFNNAD